MALQQVRAMLGPLNPIGRLLQNWLGAVTELDGGRRQSRGGIRTSFPGYLLREKSAWAVAISANG